MKKILFVSLFSLGLLALAGTAQAVDVNDLSVSLSSTVPGATADYTFTFTMPIDLTSANGGFTISLPYLYDTNWNYYVADVSNATTTSTQFTLYDKYSGSLSFTPQTDLPTGTPISLTVSNIVNPSIEGSGSVSLYGWDYTNGYEYFSGSYSIRYDDPNSIDDLIITVKTSALSGEAAVSGVWVYLSYYSPTNWSDYEYYSRQTDSNGQAYFNSLTDGRTYGVSFYYYGTATTETAPGSTTLTFTRVAGQSQIQTYHFIAPNVIVTVQDSNGNALANASWSISQTAPTWLWITSGTTNFSGLLSAGVTPPTSGTATYQVTVYDPNTYDSVSDEFTIDSSGTVSGLGSGGVLRFPSPNITGRLLAGTTPVAGVYVSLSSASYDWRNYFWDSSYTDSNGNFSFSVSAAGTYKLYVSNWGLPAGYSAPGEISVTISETELTAGKNIGDVLLAANTKTISGQVTMTGTAQARVQAGTPVTDAYLYAYNNSGGYSSTNTDSNGNYTFSLTGGSWYIYIYQQSWPATWAYAGDSIKVQFANDDTVETATYNIEVAAYDSTISGRVVYPDGTPVAQYEASISASAENIYSWASSGTDGTFVMNVVGGTYQLWLYTTSTMYGAPSLDPVTVASGSDVNLGDITLLARNSTISGSVLLNTGGGVNGTYVYAWKSDGSWDWASATTDANGNYSLAVTAGTWTIYTWAGYGWTTGEQSYSYLGGALTVVIGENETSTGNNFVFYENDSSVTFNTVDSDSAFLTSEYGWVSLSSSTSTDYGYWYGSIGCYLSQGTCTAQVPSGTYNVSYYSYSGWGYYSGATTYTYDHLEVSGTTATTVTAASGETTTADLVLLPNDVTVTGSFVDQNGNVVDDLWYADVYATNGQGGYAWTWVQQGGSYTLALSAGTWSLNYWVDPYSGYLSSGLKATTITVASGDTVSLDFTLLTLDSTINVTALDPDGNALPNAFINVNTRYGETETATASEFGLINQTSYTSIDGTGSVNMPAGTYYVTLSLPFSEGYLNPEPQIVTIDADNPANLTFTFLASDASISGTVTDGVGITVNRRSQAVGDPVSAFVYAWSDAGYYSEGTADTTGAYTVNVLQGDTWHVGAIAEGTSGYYYYSEQTEVVVDEAAETVDLSLSNSKPLPEPQTVVFQSNEPQVIILSDETEINIPANALTAENEQVTVTATPVAQIAYTADDQPVSYAYDLVALDSNNNVITDFASNVTVSIPYDETALTAEDISEDELLPEYFEDSAGDWAPITNYAVDTDNDLFVITTDHFTKFALVTGARGTQAAPQVLTAPENLRATARYAKKITLAWDEVEAADSYQVKVINKKTGKTVKTVDVTGTSETIKKLKPNKKYNFKVRSVAGDESSDWSAALTVRTKPAAPLKLKVKNITSSSAMITWKEAKRKIKRYLVRVYKAGKLVKKLRVKKAKVTLSGLKAGTKYYVRIKAKFNKHNISRFSAKKYFTTL